MLVEEAGEGSSLLQLAACFDGVLGSAKYVALKWASELPASVSKLGRCRLSRALGSPAVTGNLP